MSRLSQVFADLQADKRRGLIPYVVAGDPSAEGTVPLMHSLVDAGADILELGVPFSDPMSEGPVIQKGHERALANGMSLHRVLSMVAEFRKDNDRTPIVMMGYANPIERFGYEAFAAASAEAGVDGLITVDLPPEEVDTIDGALKDVGLDNIFLISPTTPEPRVQRIVERARGFIYYVAVKGVTGSGELDTDEVARNVALIREKTSLPIAVGFGIKNAASASAVAASADAVVVGSALIAEMEQKARSAEGLEEIQIHSAAVKLLQSIRVGVDSSPS
ncbi:MAG: tryptophan synthase subunit alpha [Halieaceae bacterium]|nr:MAG: tryptophan synthase subunit alpha [Halieaceae bacterium]|tara:strand:- start:861 stop:1688 length:828 start_codon:yes stop_codon:yes gene_type:complete